MRWQAVIWIVSIASTFTFLSVFWWALQRRRERESQLRYDLARRMMEVDDAAERAAGLAWLRAKKYEDHATPEDVFLVIEVAESTIRLDTVVKAAIYAEGGITDYWVVDIASRVVHVHRQIAQSKYLSISMSRLGEKLSPLAFRQAELDIERLFAIL